MQVNNIFIFLLLLMFLGGCSIKTNKLESQVTDFGLTKSIIKTKYFNHVLFRNDKVVNNLLYVYFGGDGKPWTNGREKASDPTGQNHLALTLMTKQNHPAIFITRPCYFGMLVQAQCRPDLWTNGRYSEQVLTSMAEVLTLTLAKLPRTKLVLVGYSGGGVIATLLANRIANVVALVTIAANLDIDLWTRVRGFQPLYDSSNPIEIVELNKDITGIHLIGKQDRVVPNEVTLAFVQKHGGLVWRYDNYGHLCCWQDDWPEISERIANLVRQTLF